MKSILKALLSYILSIFGYQSFFFLKDETTNLTFIDKNIWEGFFSKNYKEDLYYRGLEASKNMSDDNIYRHLRFYSLQNNIDYVIEQKIEGDLVECGVWKGQSAYIIAKRFSDANLIKNFHIFDSFEGGLSDKSKEDKNLRKKLTKKEVLQEKNVFSSTEEEVKTNLKQFDFVKLYKGWIPDRFKEVEELLFSFVHLDVDLYQPTLDSLEFFFPRLSKGGVIVCDDYGMTQFPGAKKAVDEYLYKKEYTLFYEVPLGGMFHN